MLKEHVDALRDYLRCHPELSWRVRFDPLRVLTGGRWKRVRSLKVSASGIELEFGRSSKTKLVPEGRVTSLRMDQRDRLIQVIQTLFRGYRVVRILARTDRLRYQSAAFLRVILESANERVAVLAAYEGEPAESRSRFLVSLVMWWDELAPSEGIARIVGLVPESWGSAIAQDVSALRIPVNLYWFRLNDLAVQPLDSPGGLSEVGSPYVIFPSSPVLPTLLKSLHADYPELDLIYRKNRWELCFRGLPVIWEACEGKLDFDHVEPRSLDSGRIESFQRHLEQVKRFRCFPPIEPGHFFYTFGREKWFESLLIRRHRLLNPDLTDEIYCQVPTWVGGERKVLDLLTVTREGRLAVLELKPQKDLTLVFQGLEYWNRVVYHLKHQDFQEAGYFTDHRLQNVPPLLYLVSPLFEFHRLLPVIRRHLDPGVKFECFGTNQDWRRGLKLLRRFQLHT